MDEWRFEASANDILSKTIFFNQKTGFLVTDQSILSKSFSLCEESKLHGVLVFVLRTSDLSVPILTGGAVRGAWHILAGSLVLVDSF